jgi:ribonuclease P/MRP protein subunit RPP40
VEDKETLEKVQRRAVGMVSNLRERSYEGRLAEAGMTSLEDRRVRG